MLPRWFYEKQSKSFRSFVFISFDFVHIIKLVAFWVDTFRLRTLVPAFPGNVGESPFGVSYEVQTEPFTRFIFKSSGRRKWMNPYEIPSFKANCSMVIVQSDLMNTFTCSAFVSEGSFASPKYPASSLCLISLCFCILQAFKAAPQNPAI